LRNCVYSQAGGDIWFGTDIGYADHFDTALEFTLMCLRPE